MSGSLTFWQTLLSGGAGGAITLAGQWIAGRQARATQVLVAAVQDDRKRRDEADAFEMEKLHEFSTYLDDYEVASLRVASLAGITDSGELKVRGDEVMDAWDQARVRLMSHIGLILDDQVRVTVVRVLSEFAQTKNSPEQEGVAKARLGLEHLGDAQDAVHSRLREILASRRSITPVSKIPKGRGNG